MINNKKNITFKASSAEKLDPLFSERVIKLIPVCLIYIQKGIIINKEFIRKKKSLFYHSPKFLMLSFFTLFSDIM